LPSLKVAQFKSFAEIRQEIDVAYGSAACPVWGIPEMLASRLMASPQVSFKRASEQSDSGIRGPGLSVNLTCIY
jgi:hypothetical protein